MKTTNSLPLITFSQVDYPIELENMFDEQQSRIFVRYTTTTGNVGATSVANFAVGDFIFITFRDTSVSGFVSLYEIRAEITAKTSSLDVTIDDAVYTAFPSGVTTVSYRLEGEDTPVDVTFGLQPLGGTTTNFRIRANSEGKGKVFIGEILRQYLPEFIAPKDYETDFIDPRYRNVNILFNGVGNEIGVWYGSKFLERTLSTLNPLGQVCKLFQEQLIGYGNATGNSNPYRLITGDYTIGANTFSVFGNEGQFNLYPSIPCKNKIYLSSNYGLLEDGELIDVSVPVLAFVNRAGQYEYIRFTGSNVNKYNVQEARLKQDYASTLTNADIGLIYEGIELTLADDNTNQGFAYRIDKLELQRCLALLMESPKAWLLVNGDLQQALEVRVKRESVVFASSFDKTYGNYTAQCEVIITQTLGQPQY
jgi:hypothetical protein